jgi:hypothetical protein
MNFISLDERTRAFMLEEIEHDLAGDAWYRSPRLTSAGLADWPDLLRDAAREGNEATLAGALRSRGRLKHTELSHTKSGREITKDVPFNAAETLAEGEFNRYYVRGVCRVAIADGMTEVEVYRAKAVQTPRSASQAKLGSRVDPQRLLDDLRRSSGTLDSALGIPAGPNSGLSVRLAQSSARSGA